MADSIYMKQKKRIFECMMYTGAYYLDVLTHICKGVECCFIRYRNEEEMLECVYKEGWRILQDLWRTIEIWECKLDLLFDKLSTYEQMMFLTMPCVREWSHAYKRFYNLVRSGTDSFLYRERIVVSTRNLLQKILSHLHEIDQWIKQYKHINQSVHAPWFNSYIEYE